MNCVSCGKELVEGSKFCLECGTKVEEPKKNVIICCGKELPEGAKFCLECGKKVGESKDNLVLTCGSCGTIPKEGKKFCSKCGADVSATGVMKPKEDSAQTDESQDQSSAVPQIVHMSSEHNPWTFDIPAFIEEMDSDMDFVDVAGSTSMLSDKIYCGFELTWLRKGTKPPKGEGTHNGKINSFFEYLDWFFWEGFDIVNDDFNFLKVVFMKKMIVLLLIWMMVRKSRLMICRLDIFNFVRKQQVTNTEHSLKKMIVSMS